MPTPNEKPNYDIIEALFPEFAQQKSNIDWASLVPERSKPDSITPVVEAAGALYR